MAVERKYERDIDILLAEEFAVSPAFAAWFLGFTGFAGCQATVVDVFVSKSDGTGESDLVVVYEEADASRRFALLIEDKIDAVLQPEQEKRYRLRAAREVERGDYQAFEVLLCAPRAYAVGRPEIAGFDRIVTYEDIAACLATDASSRARYRSNFIATAAMRNANTWTRVSDDTTNAFWDAAYVMATKEFPILERKPIRLTKGSPWIEIHPHDMPGRKVYVLLKGDRGFVDLTFTGSAAAPFAEAVAGLVEPGMSIHATGKSAAIRIVVEGFTPLEPVDEGLSKVRRAFEACSALVTFYRAHRTALDRAARDAISAEATAEASSLALG